MRIGGMDMKLRFMRPGAAAVPPSTLLDGLVSYWTLDEQSGTRADSVGDNDLSDNNTVGYDTGVNGNAASFVAANNESLTNATAITLGLGAEWTFAFWINPDADLGANWSCLMNGQPAGTGPSLRVGSDGIGAGYFIPRLLDIGGNSIYSYISDFATGWMHTFLTFDGTTLQMYRNNSTTGVTTGGSWTPAAITAGSLNIGKDIQGPNYFKGKMDEVAFWSRVLTEDERAELYNSGSGKFYPF